MSMSMSMSMSMLWPYVRHAMLWRRRCRTKILIISNQEDIMPQEPAHTDPAIVAAGMALRMQGIEPNQADLYKALDNKGHPSRLWKVWSQHLAGENDNSPRLNEHPSSRCRQR